MNGQVSNATRRKMVQGLNEPLRQANIPIAGGKLSGASLRRAIDIREGVLLNAEVFNALVNEALVCPQSQ
jgi:hypothetical protein